jgi:hypothetical protein
MGNIVWLASYPKSGNTWMRAFLANLLANRPDPVALADLPNYADLEARPDLYTRIGGQPSTQMDFAQLCALRPRVHEAIAAAAAKTVFVKTHSIAGERDGVPLHNPAVSAGAIYIVRNPLDTVISMAHHFGIDIDAAIDYLGNENSATANDELFVSELLGSWSQHVQSWTRLQGPRILVVRYEDLLDKPLKWFDKVARLVGLGADRARVERAIRHASFPSLAGMERRHGFAEVPIKGKHFFRAGRANQWRDVLAPEQARRIVAQHRQQMAALRYVPAGF